MPGSRGGPALPGRHFSIDTGQGLKRPADRERVPRPQHDTLSLTAEQHGAPTVFSMTTLIAAAERVDCRSRTRSRLGH
jgi:hypothetical protein